MKKWLLALTLYVSTLSLLRAESGADDITYEWLTTPGEGYTHYITHFKKIFNATRVKTLLEFGTGYGTKYFLDTCNKVISIDFITHGYGPGPFQHYLNLYQECPNWIPIAYFSGYQGNFPSWAPYKYLASEHLYKACTYQTVTHKNYALIDDFYRTELDSFIKGLTKCHKIDCAFIHPVLFLRSDLIELLFSRVPLIIATETNCRHEGESNDVYGYWRLRVSDDYEEIFLPGDSGMTLWIAKKEIYRTFTESLKDYAASLN
jgi:hypothetical protein